MLSRFVASIYNVCFFGVTTDSLDDLWKLYILEIIFIAMSFGYLGLIPTWAQVSEAQTHLKELNESSSNSENEQYEEIHENGEKSDEKLYTFGIE